MNGKKPKYITKSKVAQNRSAEAHGEACSLFPVPCSLFPVPLS
ncbi:MAG: hypothetical protein ACK57T_12320 [Dolichospermum sp.]